MKEIRIDVHVSHSDVSNRGGVGVKDYHPQHDLERDTDTAELAMTLNQAERDAAQLLSTSWWIGGIEGVPLPVHPDQLAQNLGIAVRYDRMASDESGKIEIPAQGTPVITLNNFDHANRQRFTCAHEIGHYISRQREHPQEDLGKTFVDHRATLAGLGVDRSEIYANQFAAALLMPPSLVRRHLTDGWPTQALARMFGTSVQALELRVRNLGLG